MSSRRIVAASALLLSGCAIDPSMVWVHPTATPHQAYRDQARCAYEANIYTPGVSFGPTPRRTRDAVAQGIAEGVATGLRQAQLVALCMQARGYYQVPAHVAQQQQPLAMIEAPPPPAPQDAPADPPVEKPPAGRWAYHVERLVRFEGCHEPQVLLTYSSVRTETYHVLCDWRPPVTMRCHFGDCYTLR